MSVAAVKSQMQAGVRQVNAPRSIGDAVYVALRLCGWLTTTILASAGLFVVLFVMAGNGSPDGFFTQVNLLAAHYLAADADRKSVV